MTTTATPQTDILTDIKKFGWVHLTDQSEDELNEICEQLGETIFTTEVVVKPESKSMVTSARGLNFHSDHPKANYIVWYCYKQTDGGGLSILLDAEKAYEKLSSTDKQGLEQIKLKEHKVFADDKDFYPLVEQVDGKRKFYFSFWLLNESDRENKSLLNFQEAIKNTEHVVLSLKEGDILIVDNDHILHGRTPITGSQDRHLRRFWISKTYFINI